MLTAAEIKRAKNIVLELIPKFATIDITKNDISKFTHGKLTLGDLGICNGVSTLIDIELQKVNPEICILSHESLVTFEDSLQKIDRRKDIRTKAFVKNYRR